jgi:hypothetical protein
MPSQKPLLHLVMDQALIDKIDHFRFEERFPSRAAAVTWLLEWAMEHNAKPKRYGWVKPDLDEPQRAFRCAVCHHRRDDHGVESPIKELVPCMYPECECRVFRMTAVAGVLTT